MRLPIYQQREIARLHFQDVDRADREIGRSVGASPNTVKSLRDSIRKAAVTWDQIQDLNDDDWVMILKNQDRSIAKNKPVPDWEHIHQEMQLPDATLEELWREFKEICPEGVQYTQFTNSYREWKRKLGLVMRMTHRPGEKLFVDFAGRTVPITNKEDGTTWSAQIFVAVLGYSNFTYVEAVRSQQIESWVKCHVNTFEAMGGAPEWVTSDRLKSAVIGSNREHIYITPAYREALKHYETAPLPAGARKPKHKAKAEVGVQIVQRWILFRLRNRIFFSLEELNEELRRLCALLNDHPFKKLPGTRRSRFEELESKTLRPLSKRPYEFCTWRHSVLIGMDYRVEHDRCFYSVPHHLVREKVDLRVTESTVEIIHRGRRIAMHSRLRVPGEMSMKREHMPVVHTQILDGEPRALAEWAARVGPNAQKMIQFHLTSRSDPTNGLRAAQRMRRLAEQYGEQRFEEACTYAMPLNITALRSITSILKESADKRERTTQTDNMPQTHENIRGPQYFGDNQ